MHGQKNIKLFEMCFLSLFYKTEMWAILFLNAKWEGGGGWIYIIISAGTEHSITAVVWSDILRQSESPDASLHNGGTNIPMSMSK